jgi:hypothetical protein
MQPPSSVPSSSPQDLATAVQADLTGCTSVEMMRRIGEVSAPARSRLPCRPC